MHYHLIMSLHSSGNDYNGQIRRRVQEERNNRTGPERRNNGDGWAAAQTPAPEPTLEARGCYSCPPTRPTPSQRANVCTMTPDEREGNATEGETKRTSHTCRRGGGKNGYFFVISDVCRGAAAVRWLVCCCCYLRQNPRTAMTATCTGELPGISIIKGETKQRAGVIPLPLKKGEILAVLS